MTLPRELLAALREALGAEGAVVRAWWDDDGRQLTIALTDEGAYADDYRETVQRLAQRVLPLVGGAGASLACGPERGVAPTVRGEVVYEREWPA